MMRKVLRSDVGMRYTQTRITKMWLHTWHECTVGFGEVSRLNNRNRGVGIPR